MSGLARLALAAAAALVAALAFTLPPAPAALERVRGSRGATVVRGAYHVHSIVSDGTGTVDEIAEAAGRAGLQFVILTDHGDGTRAPRPPHYSGSVLCLDAAEISTDEGHYAAIGLPQSPYPLGGEGRDVVEDVTRFGGLGIAAHPDSAKPGLAWHEWSAPVGGVEWFNADSQWRDESRWRLPWALLHYPFRSAATVAALFDRPATGLAAWDRLAERRPVLGIAAHDAHQRLGLSGGVDPYEEPWYLPLPGYEALFRSFAIRVALDSPFGGRPAEDAAALIAGIRAGRVFTAIDAIASPAEFEFTASSGARTARMGESLPAGEEIALAVRSNAPADAVVVLLRNGREVRERRGSGIEYPARTPGAYRAEIRLPGAPGRPPIPWVAGNPIYIGVLPPGPEPALPPATARLMWTAVAWAVERDPSSKGTVSASDQAAAPSIDLAFDLGRDAGASPYVAAVTKSTGPLRDAARVGFRVQADRPMRASVQFRLDSAAANRRWRRSFYADTTPRDLVIPYEAFRAVRPGEGPVPAPGIDALLFVVDGPNTAPGTKGRLRIDQIRTER